MNRPEPTLAPKPAHVPDARVVDFDMYALPGGERDAQLAYRAFQQQYPELFWSPRNGGHWVASRADVIESILRDHEHFSSDQIFVPRDVGTPPSLPVQVDPPKHTDLRKPLTRALFPSFIDRMEPRLRELCNSLIDEFIAKGECEFIAEFAQIFPICIFLDLVNLPRSERAVLLPIAERFVKGQTAEIRADAQRRVFEYIRDTVRARRREPGEDLLSIIVNSEVQGELISEADAISYSTLVLFGGLDTVAGMLGFITKFLAENPAHRQQLLDRLDDADFVRNALEELLRRHGIVNIARRVTQDMEFFGVQLKKDEMILPPNLFSGLDERKVDNPLIVDFERPAPRHITFGAGVHSCPGSSLARRELKVFIETWLKRIPHYQIRAGTTPVTAMGVTISLRNLDLSWPVTK